MKLNKEEFTIIQDLFVSEAYKHSKNTDRLGKLSRLYMKITKRELKEDYLSRIQIK